MSGYHDPDSGLEFASYDEYERARGGDEPWLETQIRDALERAKLAHAALSMAIDDGDDYGEHVGLQRHRRAVYTGQAEILCIWEEAMEGPLPEPPPLPPRLYGPRRDGG